MSSIVVLESGRHDFVRSIADAIADALGDSPSPPGAAPDPAPRIALPIGDRVREPEGADAVIALDPPSLARAIEARAPLRVAWVGWLDPEWEDVVARADLVVVAHRALADAVIAIGAPRSRVRVGGVIAPSADVEDRAAARAALGIDAEVPVVIVPTAVIGDDLTGMLLQLALARDGIRFLFDVGRDVEVTESLRRAAPFAAHMFGDGPIAERAWAAADRSLARVDGPELLRSLAHEVAPILAPPRARGALVARSLARDGLATIAASEVTLAVAIDEACTRASIEASRASLRALDVRGGALRLATMVRTAIDERSATRLPEGLPRGLEPIGPQGTERPTPAPEATGRDDAIERELQALRERLGKS